MVEPVMIRTAILADVTAIADLLTELNHEEENDVIANGDAIKAALFGDARPVEVSALVAVAGETIIGTVLYYPGYDTLSASYGHHLADIIVTKTARGRGTGKALLQGLAKLTLDSKKEWVSLTVLKRNDVAHEFYKALGMTQVSVHFFAAGEKALSTLLRK